MSLLICTPIYEGNLKYGYFKSMLALQSALEGNIDFDFLITTNESLIQRARNTMAAKFLETSFQKMLFIDSDIEFEPDDVAKLWNMDEKVAVGVYPMKKKGAGYSAWHRGELIHDLDQFKQPIEVDYAGTGFMMIDRSVLEEMREAFPERKHIEGTGDCFSWFDTRVLEGFYASEDYAFCHDWRSIGGKIVMDPSIRLIHHGTFGFGSA